MKMNVTERVHAHVCRYAAELGIPVRHVEGRRHPYTHGAAPGSLSPTEITSPTSPTPQDTFEIATALGFVVANPLEDSGAPWLEKTPDEQAWDRAVAWASTLTATLTALELAADARAGTWSLP